MSADASTAPGNMTNRSTLNPTTATAILAPYTLLRPYLFKTSILILRKKFPIIVERF